VHISAKLHSLHPDRKFQFNFCPESQTAYLYICVVIVAMTTQRYNLASRKSLLLRRSHNTGNRKPIKRRLQRYIVYPEIF